MYIKYKLIQRDGGDYMWNWFNKNKQWWENLQPTWKDKLHSWFVDWFYTITQKKGLQWLDLFVNMLCVYEINLKLYKDEDFRNTVNVAGMCQDEIPKDTFYCEGCLFRTKSKIARLFYGNQMDGFCYYLNRGDFTYGHYTDIIWDGCKCCGIGEDLDEEDFTSPEDVYNYDDSIEP